MKYLLIAFNLLLFTDSHACTKKVSALELAKIQSKQAAVAGCREGTKCFCYEGIDLRDAKVGMKMVDDETKPIYEDDPELGRVLVGYEQKEVEALIVDKEKEAARLAKEEELRLKRKAIQERMDKKQDAQEALLESLITDDLGNELDEKEIKENIGALKRSIKASKAQGPK